MPIDGCPDYATKTELDSVKDEIQELRDQLNQTLGETEDGEKLTVFRKGEGETLAAGALGLTLIGMAKTNAPKAIVDIIENSSGSNPFWRQLAQGVAKLQVKKGNGAIQTTAALDKFSKTTGNGAAGAVVAGQAAQGASAAAQLALFAVNLVASVGLSLANLKITGMYADAQQRNLALNEQTFNSLTSFLSRQNNKISDANAQIIATQEQLGVNSNEIAVVRQQILLTEGNVSNLRTQIQEANTRSNAIKTSLQATEQDIAELKAANIENMNYFETSIADTLASIAETEALVQSTVERLDATDLEIELIKAQLVEQENRIANLEITLDVWKIEFRELQATIGEDAELTDARLNLLEAKIVLDNHRTSVRGAGSGSLPAINGTVENQNKTLLLANNLTANPIDLEPVTTLDIQNGTDTFNRQITQLLTGISPGGDVSPEQLEALQTGINDDFNRTLQLTGIVGLVDNMVQLRNQTNFDTISDATQNGICKSLNGGGCSGTPNIPNPIQGLGGMNQALSNKMDAINAALNGTAIAQNRSILAIVQNTNDAVRHTQYGLQSAFNFAEKAWKFTRADKIVAVANLACSAHNAAMLSRNLGETLGDTASQVLQFARIKAPDGTAIDVNEIIGSSIENMIKGVIGAENYVQAKETWLAGNRILTAGRGIAMAIRGGKEAILEAHQITGGWIARIGNAVQDQGLVEDDSYRWMPPSPDFRTPFKGFLTKIDNLDEAASQVNALVNSGIEFQENTNEGIEATARLAEALNLSHDEKEADRETAIQTNESPTIPNIALVKKQGE